MTTPKRASAEPWVRWVAARKDGHVTVYLTKSEAHANASALSGYAHIVRVEIHAQCPDPLKRTNS